MPISRLSFSSISSTDSRFGGVPEERLAEPLPNPVPSVCVEAVRVEEVLVPEALVFFVVVSPFFVVVSSYSNSKSSSSCGTTSSKNSTNSIPIPSSSSHSDLGFDPSRFFARLDSYAANSFPTSSKNSANP